MGSSLPFNSLPIFLILFNIGWGWLMVILISIFTCIYAGSDLQGQQSPVLSLGNLTSWGADLQGQQLPP